MISKKNRFTTFVLFINVVALMLTSYAWFLIEEPGGSLLNLEVYTGDILQVALDPELGFQATIDFTGDITEGGFETGQHLIPVTSVDGINFFTKYGTNYAHPEDPNDRSFFEFDLYLRSPTDRFVYLGLGSDIQAEGESNLQKALRVSFTRYSDDVNRIVDTSIIWEPDSDGAGSYGEGIYDENYEDLTNPDYVCFTQLNPSGYLLCPTEAQKQTNASNTFGNEMAIPLVAPTGEDLSEVPYLIFIEGGNLDGFLLTVRIWIEGFDPDSHDVLEITSEGVELRIDFTMSLFFATRAVE